MWIMLYQSIIIMIVHFFVGQWFLLLLINLSVEFFFGVEPVSVLTCKVVSFQNWDWVPTISIQIGVILGKSTCLIIVLVDNGISLSIHRIFKLMGVLVADLVGCLPALLKLSDTYRPVWMGVLDFCFAIFAWGTSLWFINERLFGEIESSCG